MSYDKSYVMVLWILLKPGSCGPSCCASDCRRVPMRRPGRGGSPGPACASDGARSNFSCLLPPVSPSGRPAEHSWCAERCRDDHEEVSARVQKSESSLEADTGSLGQTFPRTQARHPLHGYRSTVCPAPGTGAAEMNPMKLPVLPPVCGLGDVSDRAAGYRSL